jgi:hypothetical protein
MITVRHLPYSKSIKFFPSSFIFIRQQPSTHRSKFFKLSTVFSYKTNLNISLRNVYITLSSKLLFLH